MSRYKYLIKQKADKFQFGLFPNNSNTQAMIFSKEYDTKTEAMESVKRFKLFVSNAVRSGKLDKIVRVYEQNGQYSFVFDNLQNNELYKQNKLYIKKASCYKGIKRILENINADIK